MNKENTEANPLLCDPETGVCETPIHKDTASHVTTSESKNKVKILYFTDPICSSCWAIEPQLRKLKLEYGKHLEIEYRMGGLLPDWSYNSGGISKPSDVAHHWDEMSAYYNMPIDGDVWLEDPLDSSYPPSIAFKAAQLQNPEKAFLFLRELREMVFLKKINIAKWENIAIAANNVGLDTTALKSSYEGEAKVLFEKDLAISRSHGVRGFPTIFVINSKGEKATIYGARPYAAYEGALIEAQTEITKEDYPRDWKFLFNKFGSLTAREFAELIEIPKDQAIKNLNLLTHTGQLKKWSTKNGDLWILP